MKTIEAADISHAWLEVMRVLIEPGIEELTPLIVNIGVDGDREITIQTVQNQLDASLISSGKGTCHTTANTIFPGSYWNRGIDRSELFARYQRSLPHIKDSSPLNRNGTYFERLIRYPMSAEEDAPIYNQLDHIIHTYTIGNHRTSALQASIFNPFLDHTDQRQRGFPCLQHVLFCVDDQHKMTITGVYASQYIFDRAYGNYLGLYRLGSFMAHEMEVSLHGVICFAMKARLGSISKTEARDLVDDLTETINGG
ncbi:MAG: hypothetical protein PHQ40_11560 [Anaerolineaceae bacterium]|nr:hypothetical protein [Anaerolineaceae bacterium]